MDEKKVIAVSGTPGTGKSTFSEKLSAELGYEMIDLNQVIDEEGIYEEDEEGTRIVDSDDLIRVFEKKLSKKKSGGVVIDGLLSYLLSPKQVTDVVVLRTNPDVLRERLKDRGYSERKLNDNVESEALGVVLGEAVQDHGVDNVYEIDTTEIDPDETVNLFKKAIRGEKSLSPGSVDWLEDYFTKMEDS